MSAASVPICRYLLTFTDFVEHFLPSFNSSERLIDLAKSSGPQDHRIVKTHAERLHFNSGAAALNQGWKIGGYEKVRSAVSGGAVSDDLRKKITH